jgi:hypothetical protein
MAEIHTYRLGHPTETDESGEPRLWWDPDEGWTSLEKSKLYTEEEYSLLDPEHWRLKVSYPPYDGPATPAAPEGHWKHYTQQVFRVRAEYTYAGSTYSDTPVINPGAWNKGSWLVVMGSGLHYVVEASDEGSVLDELYDNCDAAMLEMKISEEDYPDYDLDTEDSQGWENITTLGNASEPVDIDNVQVIQLEDVFYRGRPSDLY